MANTKDVLSHILRYEKKLGTKFFDDWDIHTYPWAIILPDGSVTTYGMMYDTIIIGPTTGNLKQLLKSLKLVAREVGLHYLITTTTRNPKAYTRLSGATLIDKNTYKDSPTEYVFRMEV